MHQKLLLTVLMLVTIMAAGCTTAPSTETTTGLSIGETTFAVEDASELSYVDDTTFSQGERVYLVLRDITGFEETDDGSYAPQANMTITRPNGTVVTGADRLLGNGAGQTIQDGTLPRLTTHWQTERTDPAGRYVYTVTVYDRADGSTTTTSMMLRLEPATGTGQDGSEPFGVGRTALGTENATGTVVEADDSTYEQGAVVYMLMYDVGPLQQRENEVYEFDTTMKLVSENGTVVRSREMAFGDRGRAWLSDASLGRLSAGISTDDLAAGNYTATVIVYDQVAGTQVMVNRSITLR